MVGPSRPLFVLFGSSIVQYSFSNGGWGAILTDIYARKADIIMRGYIGWNSRRAIQVLDKIFPKDASVQPSLIIVYFGGNDSIGPYPSGLGPHVPLPEYKENMRKIADHLKNLSENTRVIFLSCPPLNEEKLLQSTRCCFAEACLRLKSNNSLYPSLIALIYFHASPALSEIVRTNATCRLYSEACIQVCEEMNLKVIDLWTAFQQRDDWADTCFTDGLHFSSEGSKIVVEQILKVLKEADWNPSLHWKFMPTEFAENSSYDLVAADGISTLNPSEWTFHREIQWD
ncbi:hypothetical protein IEQ34_011991 [Dendrobium chrysotoxum]|uniref:SGNH hydrolase-type esterase domain-containing protein n=1 Tax=Dendrobium chrysotoxum TaxID=161865 RepID=A0AAV7GS22_DENCH|nr:hypothetical protein IEQ34_011991 [Dendrobium chrysotoxum]